MHAVCYHVRGYPLVEHMRAEVAAGSARRGHLRPRPLPVRRRPLPCLGLAVDPARSGPSYVVGDLGTHWLDLAEHVTGQHVTEVLADFRSFAGGPLEDYAALLLRFDGGATGSLVLSAGAAGRKNQLLFELEGDEGRLHLGPGDARPSCSSARPTAPRERSSRIRRRTPRAPAARRATPRATARATARRSGTSSRRLRGVAGEPHAPFPTFRDGAPRRRDGRGRGRSATPAAGLGQALTSRRARRRTASGSANASAISTSDAASSRRRERVHLGRDPELHLRVDVDRERVVRRRSGTA